MGQQIHVSYYCLVYSMPEGFGSTELDAPKGNDLDVLQDSLWRIHFLHLNSTNLKHQSALANGNKHHLCQPAAGPQPAQGVGHRYLPAQGPGRAEALRGPPILGAGQKKGEGIDCTVPKAWSDGLEGRSRGFSDLLGRSWGILVSRGATAFPLTYPRQADRGIVLLSPFYGREPQADPAM